LASGDGRKVDYAAFVSHMGSGCLRKENNTTNIDIKLRIQLVKPRWYLAEVPHNLLVALVSYSSHRLKIDYATVIDL